MSLCTAETGTVVLCSEPHADSVVDVPRISGQPAYPSPEELANFAGESCPAGTPYSIPSNSSGSRDTRTSSAWLSRFRAAAW